MVAISLERYFAICRPLRSRRWQTRFHAYKMIAAVWVSSLLWSVPILVVSRLKALKGNLGGRHKCREEWPSPASERGFNLFVDAALLVIPLLVMALAYSLIVSKLWKGLRRELVHRRGQGDCTNTHHTCTNLRTPCRILTQQQMEPIPGSVSALDGSTLDMNPSVSQRMGDSQVSQDYQSSL
ncbi:hypothetical protein J437_LFUL010104 [Ladona fulva]|uniref:G-protein coupled receptors family 1 profile domain-containing protein n=1 Tax=Ladona fulva TaxID=123851 RepID=A0A8K0K9X3_LADFU|nr:hypothetical protein J437_LFUL010104 [Ladona fulva]